MYGLWMFLLLWTILVNIQISNFLNFSMNLPQKENCYWFNFFILWILFLSSPATPPTVFEPLHPTAVIFWHRPSQGLPDPRRASQTLAGLPRPSQGLPRLSQGLPDPRRASQTLAGPPRPSQRLPDTRRASQTLAGLPRPSQGLPDPRSVSQTLAGLPDPCRTSQTLTGPCRPSQLSGLQTMFATNPKPTPFYIRIHNHLSSRTDNSLRKNFIYRQLYKETY